MRILILIVASLILAACDSTPNFAPVTEVSMIEPIPAQGVYKVKTGESLYEIAWRYGLDYRYLAARNDIKPPYVLESGQVINLRGKRKVVAVSAPVVNQPVVKSDSIMAAPVPVEREPNFSSSNWVWPAKGKVVNRFSNTNKGIDIGGSPGEPVYATAAGKVVYAGDGLRGYGNLIILKHNSTYLSAYAYNRVLLVKEGQWVKKGQQIAEMGANKVGKYMLHFEIRRAGMPINPMNLLSS